MTWEIGNEQASKRQRRALHVFFGRMAGHPEEVANLTAAQADAILQVAAEQAAAAVNRSFVNIEDSDGSSKK